MAEDQQQQLLRQQQWPAQQRLAVLKNHLLTSPAAASELLDVLVVGAGFSGMYLVYKFRKMGLKVKALETGSGVGGTWYW